MSQPSSSQQCSFGSSIPSSKFTENDFVCNRPNCHCENANLEDPAQNDSISARSISSSERRHAEYFYRPPILSAHREDLVAKGSPYSYFAYDHDPNQEADYCEQCQFCSASSKWCGRYPQNQSFILPRYCLNDASSICEGLYGLPDLKVKLPNTTWVQDPLIVNSAGIMCENTMPRDQDFEPAVFSHTLTDQPSHPNMEQAGHSEEDGFYEAQQNLSTGSLQQLRTINQEPARGTEYLKYFRDVRSTQEERLVIEEGSVVISIPPSFTGLPQQIIAPDEFEFRLGEVFVVCRMFADMWALCARVRNSQCIADTKEEDLHKSPNIKFLPLCCVTLASNFAPFTRRWALYRQQHPYGHVFPSGGNCITPPDRVESLEASRRYSTQRSPIPLHPMVYTLCATPKRMPADIDWVAQDDQTTELQQNENKQSTNATNGKSTAQKGTFGRVWKRFATKDTEKVTKAEKQLGLGQDGRTSYPVRSREDVPDAPEGTDGTDGTDGENTPINRNEEEKRISNRNSVRNFFTRSGRGKNGEGSGSTSQV